MKNVKKLITILIILIFFGSNSGVDRISYASSRKSALRPAAFALKNLKRIELSKGHGYDTEPISADLLMQLPGMTTGQRIAAIREARKMTKAQARRKAGIASSTYTHIEQSDTLPNPKNLFKVCKTLKIDPILIIWAKEWGKFIEDVKDNLFYEKMPLLRIRKGWTQDDMVRHLEEAGLIFTIDNLDSKRAVVAQWERGTKPLFGGQVIISKVLGDDTLFDLPEELKGDIELKIMPDVPLRSKTGFRIAFYWKDIRGCTIKEVAKKIGVSKDSVSYFLKEYGKQDVADFYGIVLRKISPKLPAKKPVKKIAKETVEEVAEDAGVDEEIIEPPIEELEQITRQEKQAEKSAWKLIKYFLESFRGKTIIQIMPLLTREKNWLAVQLALEEIIKNPEKIAQPDLEYLKNVAAKLKEATGYTIKIEPSCPFLKPQNNITRTIDSAA